MCTRVAHNCENRVPMWTHIKISYANQCGQCTLNVKSVHICAQKSVLPGGKLLFTKKKVYTKFEKGYTVHFGRHN